jgi:hypothetical protein
MLLLIVCILWLLNIACDCLCSMTLKFYLNIDLLVVPAVHVQVDGVGVVDQPVTSGDAALKTTMVAKLQKCQLFC